MIKQQINSSVILALSLAEQASLGVHGGILLTAPRTERKEVITNCWERRAYMYLGYVLAKLLHPGEGDLGVSVIIRGFIIIVKPDYNRHIPNSSSQFQVLFYFIWPFTRLHFGWKSFHENTKDDEVILKEAHVDCGKRFTDISRSTLHPCSWLFILHFSLVFLTESCSFGFGFKDLPAPPAQVKHQKLTTASWTDDKTSSTRDVDSHRWLWAFQLWIG